MTRTAQLRRPGAARCHGAHFVGPRTITRLYSVSWDLLVGLGVKDRMREAELEVVAELWLAAGAANMAGLQGSQAFVTKFQLRTSYRSMMSRPISIRA